MSTFFISVVLPHQLSANWTRIGHVAHELQPYYKTWLKLLDFFALHINVTQEDFCLANKFVAKKVSPVNRYTSHSHARSPAEVGPGKRVTT